MFGDRSTGEAIRSQNGKGGRGLSGPAAVWAPSPPCWACGCRAFSFLLFPQKGLVPGRGLSDPRRSGHLEGARRPVGEGCPWALHVWGAARVAGSAVQVQALVWEERFRPGERVPRPGTCRPRREAPAVQCLCPFCSPSKRVERVSRPRGLVLGPFTGKGWVQLLVSLVGKWPPRDDLPVARLPLTPALPRDHLQWMRVHIQFSPHLSLAAFCT